MLVIGVPRSGTNMVMQALDNRWDTDVFHEADPRLFDDYELRGDEVLARFRGRSRARLFVAKALLDLHRVAELRALFAPCRLIWVYRRVDAMVASHQAKWPEGREFLEDIVRDRAAADWRGLGMSDDSWARLKAVFRPSLSNASCVALFWWFRNRLLFEQGLAADPDCLRVNYEGLVSDPLAAWGKLCAALEIQPRPRAAGFIPRPFPRHASSRRHCPGDSRADR